MRQGRTDAWIAHQLEVSVKDIDAFKREHDAGCPTAASADRRLSRAEEEPDLRAEDDALVAAALDAEADEDDDEDDDEEDGEDGDGDEAQAPAAGAGAAEAVGAAAAAASASALEGTFDHGDEGYGLWLDPAVQDDPVYAEHWAGHRP